MRKYIEHIAVILDFLIFMGSIVVVCAWAIGKPLFYSDTSPVMSIFTGLSLFFISGVRLAKKYLYLWPFTLSIAFLLIVAGGNLSSILMLVYASKIFSGSLSSLVMTSIFTSIGLILFCTYEILILLRQTPRSVVILDDILLLLALVPGELSLIGYLFGNPTYLSVGTDPRVGISLLEMFFLAILIVSTILVNKNLFLWQFLKGGLANKIIFFVLFVNQFVIPLVYLFVFSNSSHTKSGIGLELFIMLAGVFATLGFLSIQAYKLNQDTQQI